MPVLNTKIINGHFECKCDYCGEIFNRTSKDRSKFIRNPKKKIFCDVSCSGKYKDKTVERKCKHCKAEFKAKFQDIKKGHGKFCSKSCNATYHNKNKKHGCNVSKLEFWLREKLWEKYPSLAIDYNKVNKIQAELDIYIPSLYLAFELNGIFHYKPIFGQDKLAQTLKMDKHKIETCKNNKITLYIINISDQKYFTEKSSQKYLEYIFEKIDMLYTENKSMPILEKPDSSSSKKSKKCKSCKKVFIPNKNITMFCSKKCSSKDREYANRPSDKKLLQEIKNHSYAELSIKYNAHRSTVHAWAKNAKEKVIAKS